MRQDLEPRSQRTLLVLLLLSVAAIMAMLARPMFTGSLYTYDDMSTLMAPIRYCYWKALAAGDSILWSPQFYCGYYLQGDGQVGMCHPLHWLLYRNLSFDLAFNLEFLLSYLWVFAGMFLMLRRWGLVRPAALMGAMIFAFGGFNLLHFMHPNAVAIVAHIPWLVIASEILVCSKDIKMAFLGQLAVSALIASQILLGYPQYVILSMFAVGAIVLWRIRSWSSWLRFPLFCLAVALGFAMGAVQILPTWDAVSQSERADPSLAFRTWFSMHPLNLVQLWAPYALKERYYATNRVIDGNTHEMGLHTGAFATVALAWLAIRWRDLKEKRGFILATVLFAVGMLVLAFGKYGFVYPLIAELPVWKSLPLRCPTRYVMLVQFSLAILAAYAMADILAMQERNERLPWGRLWPLAIPLGLSAVTTAAALWAIGQPSDPWRPCFGSAVEVIAGLAVISIVVALVAAAAKGFRWSLHVIVLLTCTEIAVFNVSQYVWGKTPPSRVDALLGSISPPPPLRTGRLCHIENDHGNILTMAGYDLMQGYMAMIPKKKLPIVARDSSSGQWVLYLPTLRIAAVHWVLPIGENAQWLAVPGPLPRARLVSQAIVSNDEVRAINTIDVATTAIVDREIALDLGQAGSTIWTTDRPGFLEIETSAPGQQLLVVAERYHSGWKATIDGQPATVLPAYGQYLACVVPSGKRHVAFRFEPESFVWGSRITLVGLAMALALPGLAWLWSGKPAAIAQNVPPRRAFQRQKS
ncbi:MAG: hypothetical protein ACLP9L_13675 [Thermoguttaceae bacterium]